MHPLSILIKPSSSLCNLKCDYCFYHSLADERACYSYGMISLDVADNLIDKALDFAKGHNVNFAFQGGEPLLRGISFYRYFINKVLATTHSSKVSYSLQTNGTMLDEEWCELFKKNNFLIGLSLDGTENTNQHRRFKDGSNSFNSIMRSAEMLRSYGVDYNILTVVTREIYNNIKEVYRFYRSQGFNYLQFIPCLKPLDSSPTSNLYLSPEEYGDFLNRLFELYYNDNRNGFTTSIRFFDNLLNLAMRIPTEQCGMNGHCTYQIVVESNGNLYPCDFYCIDDYCLGNITDIDFFELDKSKKVIDFIFESMEVPSKCKSCPFYKLCFNCGCKRLRADSDYCISYRIFFERNLNRLVELSRNITAKNI